MTDLVMQHHTIGKLVAELPYGENFISVIDTGFGIVAVGGKTWPATREDFLQSLHNDLWGVIVKYEALGATADDIENTVKAVLKEVGLI